MSEPKSILGTSPLRKEGRAKVLGTAQYIDDLRSTAACHSAVAANLLEDFLRSLTPERTRAYIDKPVTRRPSNCRRSIVAIPYLYGISSPPGTRCVVPA